MANGIPPPILNLFNSLTLDGVPTTVNAGDRITPRISPDLAPKDDGALPEALTNLTKEEVLAELELNAAALIGWIVAAIGIEGWAKNVEFDQSVTAPPNELRNATPVKRALPHLVPSTIPALQPSPNVEGLISQLKLATLPAAGAVDKITGKIIKPRILGTIHYPTVSVQVFDETGVELSNGDRFFKSLDFVPAVVFLPIAVQSVARQPTIRRSLSVTVSMNYTPLTPPTPPGGQPPPPVPISRTFGPIAIDLATVEVPVVAMLARHALTPGAVSGHVFVGVPSNSPLSAYNDVVMALQPLRTVLGNVFFVLNAMKGVVVPLVISDALRALNFVPTGGNIRFWKGDVLGLWAPFADWQFIMSAALVFGPAPSGAFFGSVIGASLAGFTLTPAALGVGFIPDLIVSPITAGVTVGTAVDNFPPAVGTYDNALTSIDFL